MQKPNLTDVLKKLFSFLLLLFFLYTLIGYYPVFKYQQNLAKKEIKQRLKKSVPENELSLIIIDKNNYSKINWVDKNEFTIDGKMYDVVRVEKCLNGKTKYYCINDVQEKMLFANLDKHIQNNFEGRNQNEKNNKPVNHLAKDYLPNCNFLNSFSLNSKIKFSDQKESLEIRFSESLSPPPRII